MATIKLPTRSTKLLTLADTSSITPATTTKEPAPFPFDLLPVEIQIQILENTDLVSPFSQYVWDPTRKFYLLSSDPTWININNKEESWKKRIGWDAPGRFFLVSKSFYAIASEIFWKRNLIHAGTDLAPIVQTLWRVEPRRRTYAASEFLDSVVAKNSLAHIRSLKFDFFGVADSQFSGEARDDWMRTLECARTMGLINLDFLAICAQWNDRLTWNMLNVEDDDELMNRIVSFIDENIWPMECGMIPFGVAKGFVVGVGSLQGRFWYRIKRMGEDSPACHREKKCWGNVRIVRPFPMQQGWNSRRGRGDNKEKDYWLVEIWAQKVNM